jgi:hypothetical protein
MTTKPKSQPAVDEPADLEVPEPVVARRFARSEDYSKWVALEQIYYDGGLAYNPGDPVPDTNVQRHHYDEAGLVRRADQEE